jgi:hypothetical protein
VECGTRSFWFRDCSFAVLRTWLHRRTEANHGDRGVAAADDRGPRFGSEGLGKRQEGWQVMDTSKASVFRYFLLSINICEFAEGMQDVQKTGEPALLLENDWLIARGGV